MHGENVNEQITGLFSSQFDQIKNVEDPAERTYYYAMFGYDLITRQCKALEEDGGTITRGFTRDAAYESHLLPGVGGNASYKDPLRVYHTPEKPFQNCIFEVGGYSVARVPQGYMYIFPLKLNPLLYVSMTECSALVTHDEENLYVAHIGLSETGEVVGALDILESAV